MKIKAKYIEIMIFCIIICLIIILPVIKFIQHRNFPEIIYGPDLKQRINLTMPKNKSDAYAIVFFHGGGFSGGDKLSYPLFLREFAENNNIFATIGYRLIKKGLMGTESAITMNDIIADVDAAIMKIYDVSKEQGINIKGVILTGHSAGGHIALQYGYQYFNENDNREIKIIACISMAGSTDLTDIFWPAMSHWGENLDKRFQSHSWRITELTGYPIVIDQYNWTEQDNWNEYQGYLEAISPITYAKINQKLPPALLVHALDDMCVPYSNSFKLAEALNGASIQNKLITVTGSGNSHFLGGKMKKLLTPYRFSNQTWVNETIAWIQAFLK